MRASLRGPRPEDTSAIGRHWRRWLSSASSTAVESPAIESWWGRPGSPSMTKRWLLTSLPRLPIRSHLIGQTHTHRSSRFLSPLRLSPFPSFSSSFARFEACIRAGTCGDRAASREFNNCRSSRSRVNTVPRARSFYERLDISRIYIYVCICMYTRGQGLLRLSSETSDRSFPADWDSENYDAVPRSSLKISLRNPIVKIGEKCRD